MGHTGGRAHHTWPDLQLSLLVIALYSPGLLILDRWSFTHCTSWYLCSKDTSIFPGMAFTTEVLIWGVPSCKLVTSVFIRCPTSSSGWVGAGGQSGCPLGSHPPPLRKVILPIIHIGVPISHWISPRVRWWVPGWCIYFPESNLPVEILHELPQLVICRVPKVHL